MLTKARLGELGDLADAGDTPADWACRELIGEVREIQLAAHGARSTLRVALRDENAVNLRSLAEKALELLDGLAPLLPDSTT